MRIMVAGVLSLPPLSPGIAWDWLQVAVGFKRLGHQVYFLEEVDSDWCFDDSGEPCEYSKSLNKRLFERMMNQFDLMPTACQVYNHDEATTGLSQDSLISAVKEVDVLINMSGHARNDFILENAKRRVYVDQDPVYTQLWRAEYGKDLDFDRHDVFFTMGLNIGTSHTDIPDCGVVWHHMLPPIVPEFWGLDSDSDTGRFSTIASWSGYDDLQFKGKWYRSKYVEFQRFSELPRHVDQELEIALKSFRDDDPGIRELRSNGWILSNANRVNSLETYQRFISASRAEIGIAQNAYVKGNSGWFSDRAAHYLASGRPVLAQSTGFERSVPTGCGLLSFSTLEEAVSGIEAINRDYNTHCLAARELAMEYLDYRKILPSVLEAATG